MATLTDIQLEQIVDDLRGQCARSLEDCLEEMGVDYLALDPADHAAIDERVFCCEGCAWWCEAEELNNETDRNLCDECNEEEEE